MSETDRWLAGRASGVPEPLAGELDREEEADSVPASLLERGLASLSRARTGPPRDRDAAYRLLAADAYVTYACEAAAECEDEPGEILERILKRLAAEVS